MKKVFLVSIFLALFAVSVYAQTVQVDSISADPSPVIPGQTFTLYAYLTNVSSIPAKGVQATLVLGQDSTDTSFPFSIEPTDTLTRELGTVPGFATVQVKYQIQVDSQALDGIYPIVLNVTDSVGSGGGTLTYNVNVVSRKPILSIIQATPTFVKAGETVTIQLTYKNTGSSPAFDILAGLTEDRTVTSGGVIVERNIIPLGAAFAYASTLGVGDTTTISIPLLINPASESKPTFVPITLTYYDSNKTQYTSTDFIGLKVSAEPILNVLTAEAEPLLVPGKLSRLAIDVYNVGLGPAKFVTASVQVDFLAAPQKQFFIGTIESDDFDTLFLDGVVSSSISPGDHPVTVTITAKNEYGDPITVTQILNAKVYSSSAANGNGSEGFPLWIIVLVLVVIGYWWFKMRKPKATGKK